MKLISNEIIEEIVSLLGLMFLSEEKRVEFLERILKIIGERAGVRIISEFSEEETKEFNKIPKDDIDQMEDFIIAKNPSAKEIFREEAKRIMEKILSAEVEIDLDIKKSEKAASRVH